MRTRDFLVAAALAACALAGAARARPSGCRPRAVVEMHPVTEWTADRLRRQPSTTRGARPGEFLLGDGRVLVQESAGADGAVYTPEAFKLRRAQLDEDLRFRRVSAGESFHVLRSLIDDGETFTARAPSLAADLKRRLAGEGLGERGADAATKMVARWREANCRLDATLFRELTAWAGELVIERAGGHWVTHAGDLGVIEPTIEVSVGGELRQLAPWLWVSALLDGSVAELEPLVAAALAPAPPADKSIAVAAPGAPPAAHPLGEHAAAPSELKLPVDEKGVPDSIKLQDPGF